MSHRKHTIICFEGIIGAGKSSVIKEFSLDFFPTDDFKCFVEPVDKWTLLPIFYKTLDMNNPTSNSTIASALQLQILLSQFDQFNSFPDEKEFILVERCPWTSKNIFLPLLVQDECFLSCYNKIYDEIAYDVDYFIYLKVPAEIAFERIQKRNRTCESKSITIDYLRNLEKQTEQVFNKLREQQQQQSGNEKVFIIDASKSFQQVIRDVASILEKLQKK